MKEIFIGVFFLLNAQGEPAQAPAVMAFPTEEACEAELQKGRDYLEEYKYNAPFDSPVQELEVAGHCFGSSNLK